MKSIFQNKDSREIYFYLFFLFVLFFLIFNYSFQDGIPTCRHYMMNIYLYLGLALTIIGMLCYLMEYHNININMMTSFLSFLLTLIFIFIIHYVSPMKNSFINHICWFILLIGFSIMIYPVVSLPSIQPYINQTILIVIVIFLFMTWITYLKPAFFETTYSSMMTGLMIALVSIIIIEIVNLIYKSITGNFEYTMFNKGISYIVVIIFSLLVSYDTTRLKMKSRSCKETNIMNYPNYPKESLGLILDILNLFLRILSLQKN